jgi:hypothetical protein
MFLIKEAQILCSCCIDEMDADFTILDLKEVTLRMKKNKEAGCDGIPAEAGNWLLNMKELKY